MGKGSGRFDSQKFQSKLSAVVNERDSICSLSSLFFHNKDFASSAVQQWNEAFKRGDTEHRLALVYLVNEILHNCKRKEASVFKDEFRKILPRALSLLRGSAIADKVHRVLDLWSDRKILESRVCQELSTCLSGTSGSIEDAKIDAEMIKNFSPDAVINLLKEFLIFETEVATKEKQLNLANVDIKSSSAIQQLKDREQGEAFRQQFEDSCLRLEDFVRDLKQEAEKRQELMQQLQKARMFFAAQYSDVNVVVTAYKKYGEMIEFMKRRVQEKLHSLPTESTITAAVAAYGSADATFDPDRHNHDDNNDDDNHVADDDADDRRSGSRKHKKHKKHKKHSGKHRRRSRSRSPHSSPDQQQRDQGDAGSSSRDQRSPTPTLDEPSVATQQQNKSLTDAGSALSMITSFISRSIPQQRPWGQWNNQAVSPGAATSQRPPMPPPPPTFFPPAPAPAFSQQQPPPQQQQAAMAGGYFTPVPFSQVQLATTNATADSDERIGVMHQQPQSAPAAYSFGPNHQHQHHQPNNHLPNTPNAANNQWRPQHQHHIPQYRPPV